MNTGKRGTISITILMRIVLYWCQMGNRPLPNGWQCKDRGSQMKTPAVYSKRSEQCPMRHPTPSMFRNFASKGRISVNVSATDFAHLTQPAVSGTMNNVPSVTPVCLWDFQHEIFHSRHHNPIPYYSLADDRLRGLIHDSRKI